MTDTEKLKIQILFEQLFKQEPFAYTLFFDKPFSFSEILYPKLPDSILINNMNIDQYTELSLSPNLSSDCFEEAWNIWEKYQSKLINKEKYLLVKRNLDGKPIVLMVNIDQFKKTFNQHIDVFQRKFLDADLIIKKIKESNVDLNELFGDFELGVLLGFGLHNSKLFEARELKEKEIHRWNCLSPTSSMKKNIQYQIDHLWEILCIKDDDFYCSNVALPFLINFVSDKNNEETIYLNRKYREQSKKISEILYANDWFDQIIIKLRN
jgi:hypothetical protein